MATGRISHDAIPKRCVPNVRLWFRHCHTFAHPKMESYYYYLSSTSGGKGASCTDYTTTCPAQSEVGHSSMPVGILRRKSISISDRCVWHARWMGFPTLQTILFESALIPQSPHHHQERNTVVVLHPHRYILSLLCPGYREQGINVVKPLQPIRRRRWMWTEERLSLRNVSGEADMETT